MRVIITFLGLYPKLTEYQYQNKVYSGEVFAEALCQFCQFDRMLVCVTSEAKINTWPILERRNDSRIEYLEIPNGETTAQMWETFTKIVQHIQIGDELIFDITHGLRSLPFLVFLFAAYLRSAKQADIQFVYYGAYELGKGKPAPVIDLTEFVGMLDWLTATNTFLQSGNSQALAQLLQAHKPLGKNLKARQQQQDLQRVANAISKISLALQTNRPIEVMEAATDLEETLQVSNNSITQWAKPFSLLQERILTEYGQFALAKPESNSRIRARLDKEFEMITWYMEHQHLVQAATLIHEWINSALESNYFNRQQLLYIKEEARKLRNDMAHAGKDIARRQEATTIQTQMQKVYQDLKQLYGAES
ncbi:CRISPR-associated protein, Csx2 family [Leptolyngbya sp. PCC 7375]|nr:CRISPR-associated protein, Csx2 family [Leptolyngbya sp. PCC 7375]